MDQTNPLSELTNKRRISALGPGGHAVLSDRHAPEPARRENGGGQAQSRKKAEEFPGGYAGAGTAQNQTEPDGL